MNGGYICPHCGVWVPNGIYHYCSIPYSLPSTHRNYKCSCGGEFDYPESKEGKYVCPFCGQEMKGK